MFQWAGRMRHKIKLVLPLLSVALSTCTRGDTSTKALATSAPVEKTNEANDKPESSTTIPKATDEEPMTIERLCETARCRKNLTVELVQDDGTNFKKTYALVAPVVQNRLISVHAGETVLVEATTTADDQINYAFVEIIADPERTFTFKLDQHEKDGKVFMMLKSTNPLSRDVRLGMKMMPLSTGSIVPTSSCPVAAGKMTFEIWPNALFQILIDDIRFMQPDESHACN